MAWKTYFTPSPMSVGRAMRITKIKVNNFKSLVDFEIDLAKFNCIVGLNGSGKSTFLQFMGFLSRLMRGNIFGWLHQRHWTVDDFVPHLDHQTHDEVHFEIDFVRDGIDGQWIADYDTRRMYCFYEQLSRGDLVFEAIKTTSRQDYVLLSEFKSVGYSRTKHCFKREVLAESPIPINFNYQGSIFSQLADAKVSEAFREEISFFRNIRSFDLLSPYFLKQNSKSSQGSIGYSGENVAAFFHGIPDATRAKIVSKVRQAYPAFNTYEVVSVQDGTKALEIREKFFDGTVDYSTAARHVNDGLLRILAMLGQLNMDDPFLLFDEIENGINQELVDFLLKELIEARQQIVVTTHSMLFLNFLDDDLARDCVQYFYKTPEGFTRCRKFFSLPSTAKKLGALGPGEALADTNLYRLNEEIEQLDRQAVKKEG